MFKYLAPVLWVLLVSLAPACTNDTATVDCQGAQPAIAAAEAAPGTSATVPLAATAAIDASRGANGERSAPVSSPTELSTAQPAARALVVTAEHEMTSTEAYAQRAFELLGIEVQKVTVDALTEEAFQSSSQRVFWFATHEALTRASDDTLALLKACLEQGAFGFVPEIDGPADEIALLTGNAVTGAAVLPNGTPAVSRYTEHLPELTQELTGIEFVHSPEWANRYLELGADGAAIPIIEATGPADGLARLAAVQHGAGMVLLQAGQSGDPTLAKPLRQALAGDYRQGILNVPAMLEAVPTLLFAKFAAGDAAWHNPERLANLTIDDPPVAQPFWGAEWTSSFHTELLAHAQQQNFHVTMATVPAHFVLAQSDVAELYRQYPDRLSLSVHGRDHTCPDFRPELTQAELLSQIREARQWMDALTKAHGIEYGKVMTFPCDGFAIRDLQAIKHWNFIAGSNTPDPADLMDDVAWDHHAAYVTSIDGGAPHATRQPVEDTVFPLDFALDRPVVLFVHPQFFEPGYDQFNTWAERINAVGDVRWVSVEEAIRRHVWQKRNADGTYSAQLFTADAIIRNPGDTERRYQAWLQYDGTPAIAEVLVDAQPVPYVVSDGAIRLELSVPAGSERSVRVRYQEPQPDEYQTSGRILKLTPSGPNLLANPSFELGTTGWSTWHASFEVITSGRLSNHAARITWEDPGEEDPQRHRLSFGDWPGAVPNPKPGDTYVATAWIRGTGKAIGLPARLVLREYTADGARSESTFGSVAMIGEQWQQVMVMRTIELADAANLTVQLEIDGAGPGLTVDVDDFDLWLHTTAQPAEQPANANREE